MRILKPLVVAAVAAAVLTAGTVSAGKPSAARAVTKRDAYFTDLDAGKVYRVEVKFRSTPKLKLRKTFSSVANPWGVAVDPDEKFLMVTDFDQDLVYRLQLPKGKVLAQIPVGKGPTDVGLDPTGDWAYVVNSKDNTLTAIDTRTDTVVATVPLAKGPLRLDVNDRGTSAYVTAVDADIVHKVNIRAMVGLDDDPGDVVVQNVSDGCDVSGGVTSVHFAPPGPFNYIMWTCGTGAVAASGSGASATAATMARDSFSHDGEEDDSDDCSSSSSSDSCSDDDRLRLADARRTPLAPEVKSPFPFSVPGGPDGLVATGISRAPSYANGFCTSDSIVVSYSEPDSARAALGDDEAWLWHFGETGVMLANGMTFGPLFGGGGDTVYANPICGKGCSAKQIASKTKSLKIAGAENIMDGDMLPVAFGPDC